MTYYCYLLGFGNDVFRLTLPFRKEMVSYGLLINQPYYHLLVSKDWWLRR